MSVITAIPGALQNATSMVRRAQSNLDRDASVVANSADLSSLDALTALVDARQQVIYTQAAAKLVSATDAITKALLDIHA